MLCQDEYIISTVGCPTVLQNSIPIYEMLTCLIGEIEKEGEMFTDKTAHLQEESDSRKLCISS